MQDKAFSFGGKILRVDLTSGKIWTELTKKYAERFLGGRGVNSWILYKEVKPCVSPLDPANRLIFGTGALVGTLVPCASRLSVDAKNPLTGGVGSANSGGHFSAELKFAGYDHIVFEGRAKKPVYLWINDDQVEIMDASQIWGKETGETEDIITAHLGEGEVQIACIGPAGENLANSACIIADRARAAGRCGLGAVMGSKNLKAAVVRGSGSMEVAHAERFMRMVDKAWGMIDVSKNANQRRAWGQFRSPELFNDLGQLPVRNFQDDYLNPNVFEKINPLVYKREYEVGRMSCFACPIYCSHFYKIKEGPYAGLACEGFELNDILNFVAKLEIDYPPAVIKLHSLCSEFGLDQDNASGAVAWAFECYQRGIFTQADTNGLKLEWGDDGVVAELLRKIAYREGIGDLLAEGSKRASEIIGKGSEKFAIHIKGQDSIEALRGSGRSWALGCVVSTRGGTHTRGANLIENMVIPEDVCKRIWGISRIEGPLSYKNKALLVVYYERVQAILDSLGLCLFASNWSSPDLLGPDDLAQLYSAATGNEINEDELMRSGERLHNIEKVFNVLHSGFDRKDDYPPQRFREEPIQSGPLKGERLIEEEWDRLLDEYYGFHKWDVKTGWPTRKCLEDLELKELADDLVKVGRLPS